jgi:UDP-N-acetylmuramoylalanine--D-glutamate ligase
MVAASVSGKRISVIGAGRSGVAVAELLAKHGARIFVSDNGNDEAIGSQIGILKSLGIPWEVGEHSEKVFDCSLMVISPGVPTSAPVVAEAQRRSIEVVSELEVASWYCRAPMVAVTGSNGKTTTTTLIGRILGDANKRHAVAGNIGTAFSSVAEELDETSVAVLEVSSFQLDTCKTFRPRVSMILNITEDHMDRYDHSMEKYSASKARVFMNQMGEDTLLTNADDAGSQKVVAQARCRILPFSVTERLDSGAFLEGRNMVTVVEGKREVVIPADEISIPGIHNLYNAMAATLAGQLSGVSVPSIRATLRNFKGVEHRLEFVREVGGVRFINDSKATNVDAVWYALQAYRVPIVLMLGGRDKGNDYSRLFDLVRKNVRAVVAMGESVGKVVAALQDKARLEVVRTEGSEIPNRASMDKAVRTAYGLAKPGDVVMLSPACASFDWFKNYEERGKIFKAIVQALS